MRRKVIAGNWKMNMLPNEAIDFIQELTPLVKDTKNEVILCVPYTDLFYALLHVQDTNIKIGAQNMHFEEKGAYTGELSPEMLVDAGVSYVIIGHSERRQYFHETDEIINKKMRKAIEHKLLPILCCGESLEQRESGVTLEFIKKQIVNAFKYIPPEKVINCIIAYEPIWAIGTGRVATAEQAQEVCSAIRTNIRDIYGAVVAERIRILYGGSVNAGNANHIFSMPDIDGGLVGGASLKPEFAKIVHYDK